GLVPAGAEMPRAGRLLVMDGDFVGPVAPERRMGDAAEVISVGLPGALDLADVTVNLIVVRVIGNDRPDLFSGMVEHDGGPPLLAALRGWQQVGDKPVGGGGWVPCRRVGPRAAKIGNHERARHHADQEQRNKPTSLNAPLAGLGRGGWRVHAGASCGHLKSPN